MKSKNIFNLRSHYTVISWNQQHNNQRMEVSNSIVCQSILNIQKAHADPGITELKNKIVCFTAQVVDLQSKLEGLQEAEINLHQIS
jgi:hypothetical protein